MSAESESESVAVGIRVRIRGRVLPLVFLSFLGCDASRAPIAAPAATPLPAPSPAFTSGLVDVTSVAPGVRLDMRYAIADNFLGRAVYPCARCLLTEDAAAALAKAQARLAKDGYGLLLWDCYRPRDVQREMWKLVPDPRYVANPETGSVHNRAGAIDVTLVDAKGTPLELPTAHDDFSEKAYADAPASAAATKNRARLRAALEAEGYTVMPTEWWHFDAAGSRAKPLIDAALCENQPR